MLLQFFALAVISLSAECPKNADKELRPLTSPTSFLNAECGSVDIRFATTDESDSNPNVYTEIKQSFFKGATLKSITISSKITEIESNAFEGAKIIESINFAAAESLTTISSFAFKGATIPSISLPSGISSVGASAFEGCTLDGDFNFGSSKDLTTMSGERIFADAHITGSLTWPSDLSTVYEPSNPGDEDQLENCIFHHCEIETLNLKAAPFTTLPSYFLYNVDQISSITLPDKLKIIPSGAFKSAKIEGKISFPKDTENIVSNAFEGSTLGQLDFSLAKEIEKINSNVFKDSTIDSINPFPPNLRTIEKGAFMGGLLYSTIKFPSNLEKIKGSAFEGKHGFTTLDFSEASALTDIEERAFYDTDVSSPINFPRNLNKIGKNAFEKSPLSTVTFNSNLESIDNEAFKNIITLTALNNLKVKTIGTSSFEGCQNMVAATIQILSSGKIGGNAFFKCYKLGSELEILEAKDRKEDGTLIYSTIGGSAFKSSGIHKITIPFYIESIGASAFENCTSLSGAGSLTLKEINGNAFKDDNELILESINATTIQASAFENCRKLNADIQLYYYGNIKKAAFKNCEKLKSLKILYYEEDEVETKDKHEIDELSVIEEEAFYRSGLKGSLIIPITVIEIGKNAFAHCKSLTSLTINGCDDDKLILKIREKAFYRSGLNGKLTLPYSAAYVGDYAFAYCPINQLEIHGTDHSFEVLLGVKEKPDGTQEEVKQQIDKQSFIGKYSFYSCGIKSLTFLDSDIAFDKTTFRGCQINSLSLGNIKTIPLEAFYGMSSLNTAVSIPDSVTSIKDRAFACCTSLPSVSFTPASQLTDLSTGAFFGCTLLGTVTNVPDELTIINEYTFYKCRGLKSFEIGDLITQIDSFAFYGCELLGGPLKFPIELTSIGESAFQGCFQLSGSLEFPDSVTKVDSKAFMGCEKLNGHVTFGRDITTIGNQAFADCSGFIEYLTFPERLYNSQKLSIGQAAFYGCSGFKGDLILPKGASLSKDAFHGCSGFDGKLDLYDMKSVPEGAFYDCFGFTGTIPTKDLESIAKHAFHGCYGFTGPLDLSSLKKEKDDQGKETGLNINEYAFCNCRGLNDLLILPAALSEVKEHAFEGCSGLKGTLDCSEFTHIHKYAFAGCSSLTGNLDFEDTLTNVEQYAFLDCSGFSNSLTFRIDESLDIDQCAFKGCTGFKNGKLSFMMKDYEEDIKVGGFADNDRYAPYYRYDYFLKIGNEAFKDTKFKNVYYLGRFEPDCDYDIGISQIKGIHTSSNYANKTFCNYPLHKSKLSGGAIAGIVIACIVVVAAIIILIVFFVLKAKKNKDQSEGEVEMNGDP